MPDFISAGRVRRAVDDDARVRILVNDEIIVIAYILRTSIVTSIHLCRIRVQSGLGTISQLKLRKIVAVEAFYARAFAVRRPGAGEQFRPTKSGNR